MKELLNKAWIGLGHMVETEEAYTPKEIAKSIATNAGTFIATEALTGSLTLGFIAGATADLARQAYVGYEKHKNRDFVFEIVTGQSTIED